MSNFESKLDEAVRVFALCEKDWAELTDEEQDEIEDPMELFKECIIRDAPSEEDHLTYKNCGGLSTWGEGAKIEDGVKGLYRLLHLVEPPVTHFGDCYKGEIFRFYSADLRCVVIVEFWKHELAMRFYCLEEMLDEPKPRSGVRYNEPGFKNPGDRECKDELGKKFFEMVTKVVNQEWCLYGGNDFTV